ncbi:helix-turn-helix domain-containing protein [Terrimonas sp. NA20]|uniref:Helix-turn-helix domain-containing protein n=1 Tax=Terrimonas ginsenosidimutans TaxID=2908004 RepID=A0ABS9KMA2_9BACT|nr:helix-turn-helix transcriptional regulator [Terrimonas ginsenosidimutans]MCG2613452.1 helix-turn-helix domain-containing protein [Terrimonas ginsenosidimutans]
MTEFLYLLIVLGSLQGVITALLLSIRGRSTYADRLLALIILVTALPGFHLYLHYKAFFELSGSTAIIHAVIPWILVTALGPLILFYVKAVLDPHFRVRRKEALWFLPVIIDLFPKMLELGTFTSLLSATTAELAEFSDLYNKYADIPRWIVLAISISVARKQLRDHRSSENILSQKQTGSFNWLSQFINVFRIFLLLWLVFLVPYVLPFSERLLQTVGWFPVYLPMAAMIYWLGIRGYLSTRPVALEEDGKNKRKTAMEETEMTRIVNELTILLRDQKLFLDPALDLAALSAVSNIPARSISSSLNQHLGKTFNQFLNEFRVEEFKQRSASLHDLSIAGLASECGFPSLPTFQRVFKQVTGQTPSEYLRGVAT